MTWSGTYAYRVLVGCDQLANAIFGGYPDETLSSRAYRKARLAKSPLKRWIVLYHLINTLFFWMRDHCEHAYLTERHRKQYPPSLR